MRRSSHAKAKANNVFRQAQAMLKDGVAHTSIETIPVSPRFPDVCVSTLLEEIDLFHEGTGTILIFIPQC